MIGPDQVMPLLLEACPSFRAAWDADVESEYADDDAPGGRLLYLDAGAFIRHLCSLQVQGPTDEFAAVFDTIERLAIEGDDYVQNLAVIGYIEGFQMMTVTSFGLDPERDFRPWLRPVSASWWQRVNRFWDGDARALQDPPSDD